jgi:dienelactone hydrolase
MSQCGHEKLTNSLEKNIENITNDLVIIGFSAGASAAFRVASQEQFSHVKHVIGFYPSQIRHHLDLVACVDVTLLFPKEEPHFEVDKVMTDLKEQEKISAYKVQAKHGFMNSLSVNYHPELAAQFNESLQQAGSLVAAQPFYQSIRKIITNI